MRGHGLWRHSLHNIGIVDEKGDLNYDFVREYAAGTTQLCDDTRDQAFMDVFLDSNPLIETQFKQKSKSFHPYAEDEEPEPDIPSLTSQSRKLMSRTLLEQPFVVSTTSNAAATFLRDKRDDYERKLSEQEVRHHAKLKAAHNELELWGDGGKGGGKRGVSASFHYSSA